MNILQTLVRSAMIISVTTASCTLVNSQDTTPVAKPPSFAASISMKQKVYSAGQTPWLVLANKNLTKHPVLLTGQGLHCRLHLEGEKGEPPRTLYYRRLRGEPGVPGLDGGGPSRFPIFPPGEKQYEGIPPGESDVREFDLTAFYDLTPGKYTIHMEVLDLSGIWMRTNTVQFEVLAPAQ